MIIKGLILLVLLIFTAACAPSPEAIQEAIRQTQAAVPTPLPPHTAPQPDRCSHAPTRAHHTARGCKLSGFARARGGPPQRI